ncbi:hypothetical protein PCE1_004007 [Barthelona sp. PCE]
MKYLIFTVLVLLCVTSAFNKDDLKFNKDGTFKVVQFTDLHFTDYCHNDTKTQELMTMVLNEEKPDLVIITGDLISGWLLKQSSVVSWKQAVKPIIDLGYPYAWVFGNHDHQGDLDYKGVLAYDKSLSDLTLVEEGPEDVAGHSNYHLTIKSAKSNEPAHVMYFLDTHAKVPKHSHMQGMDFIKPSQVNWYYETSKQLESQHGKMQGSMWFHIPIPEYEKQWFCRKSYGHMDDWDIGVPFVNGGIYGAAADRGDVSNMFCGHAHMCDFRGVHYDGIQLLFGRSTGFSGYGTLQKGARVVEIHEGERNIKTWLRLADNTVVLRQTEHEPEAGRCYFRPYKPW